MNTYLNANVILDGSIPKEKFGKIDVNVQAVDTGDVLDDVNVIFELSINLGATIPP